MPQQNSAAATQGLRHLDELTQERMRELEAAMQPALSAPAQLLANQSLRRTGKRSFAFDGTLVAMTCGVTPALPFWYEINVYRAAAGGWVSDIRLFNKAEGSSDVFRVAEHADLDGVLDHLEHYDPTGDLTPERALTDPTTSNAALALLTARLQMQVNQIGDHYRGLLAELLHRLESVAA